MCGRSRSKKSVKGDDDDSVEGLRSLVDHVYRSV